MKNTTEQSQALPVKKSRADAMRKSRARAAGFLRDVRLTERAAANVDRLVVEWGMTKTQIVNKLLEEFDQRSLPL